MSKLAYFYPDWQSSGSAIFIAEWLAPGGVCASEAYMGIPIETLRVRVGLLKTDASKDALIDFTFAIALSALENYLDRKLAKALQNEEFVHFCGSAVQLMAYPVSSVVYVTADGVTDPPYHIDLENGLLLFDDYKVSHELAVSYCGGYQKFSGTLKHAVLGTFDNAWNMMISTSSSSASLSLQTRSTSIDGMRVEYFDENSTESSAVGFIPSNIVQSIKRYKRQAA